MIPKIIHQVWGLSGNPIPSEYAAYQETWKKHHPEWEYRLWTRENLPPMINRSIFDQLNNYAAKADVLRYELLYQFGGWYADMDTECFKPIDSLLLGKDIALLYEPEPPRTDLVANCFMGCTPYHPFLRHVLTELPFYAFRTDWPIVGATGPKFLGIVAEKYPVEITLPREKLLPYMWNEKERRNEVFTDAFAVHHWACGWR